VGIFDIEKTASTNNVEADGLKGDELVEIGRHDGDVEGVIGIEGDGNGETLMSYNLTRY
jgi:hypothetical protein